VKIEAVQKVYLYLYTTIIKFPNSKGLDEIKAIQKLPEQAMANHYVMERKR
jgi:hypothetical protein